MTGTALPVDAGLLARFRDAGREIVWRDAARARRGPRGRTARIAHLHDEDARVETWGEAPDGGVVVDSGPVGALVLLLEIDRRGPPARLGAGEAGRDSVFPTGSLAAGWGLTAVPRDSLPRLGDLVELARYALR